MKATDPDFRDKVTYKLISPTDLFSLEPQSNGDGAVLKLIKTLDYESSKSHILTVKASVSFHLEIFSFQ